MAVRIKPIQPVPQWVLDEYAIAAARSEPNSERLRIAASIIESEKTRSIWGTLGKLRGLLDQRAQEDPFYDWAYATTIGVIASTLTGARGVFRHSLSRVSKKQAEGIRETIATHARTLSSVLKLIGHGDPHRHLLTFDDIPSFTTVIALDLMNAAWRADLHPEISAEHREDVTLGNAMAIAVKFTALLDGIADEVTRVVGPTVGQPRDADAERSYCMYALNERFWSQYKRPLNPVNLAVTSVFYDCGHMDASEVANIVKRAESRIKAERQKSIEQNPE